MGDTSSDPVDHRRTSRPRVGQALKSPAKVPGLLFVLVGVVAFGICVASFAQRQTDVGIAAAVIALLAVGVGGAWLAIEARRVRGIEQDRNINHRDGG